MMQLDKENFEAEVLQYQGPVMVDFWSPKCEPCMALLPEVEKISEKHAAKVKFGKVNALENRRLCIGQKVLGLPTIAFYRNGEKVAELTKDDATPENIEKKLQELFLS